MCAFEYWNCFVSMTQNFPIDYDMIVDFHAWEMWIDEHMSDNIEKWNGIWIVTWKLWDEMEMKWYMNVKCYVLHCIECNECGCKNMKWNGNEMKWNGNEMNVNARHYEKYVMLCAVWNGMQRMWMQEYEMKWKWK